MFGVGDDGVVAAVEGAAPDTELFLDERGSLLRARCVDGAVLLSVWRDGRCVATQRLARADAERLATLLTGCSDAALASLSP
jgi:hypothetical protein